MVAAGIKVATLKNGDTFGELALVTNAPRSATVQCVTDNGILWTIDRLAFRGLLAQGGRRGEETSILCKPLYYIIITIIIYLT